MVVRRRHAILLVDVRRHARGHAVPVQRGPPSTPIDVASPIRIVAFDDRLQRRVWMDVLPRGTAPLPAWRRDLGRPTRLRWLAGRRDGDECWDAYEAVEGLPFSSHAGTPQPWSRVRHWLSDLTREVAAAAEDGALPVLLPERVWIGADGHARLLERPAPGQPDAADDDPGAAGLPSAQKFLYAVATAALTGAAFDEAARLAPDLPLPLRARTFLLALRDAKFPSAADLLHGLEDVAEVPAAVAKTSRGLQIAVSGAFPIGVAIATIVGILFLGAMRGSDERIALGTLIEELEDAEEALAGGPNPAEQQKQDDIEIAGALWAWQHPARGIQDRIAGTWIVPR